MLEDVGFERTKLPGLQGTLRKVEFSCQTDGEVPEVTKVITP